MTAPEEELDIERHDLSFNSFLCHICKNKDSFSKSKVCAGCKLISYCGVEHQKSHWRNHKRFCLTAQKMCRELNVNNVFAIPVCLKNPTPKTVWCQKRWNLKNLFEQQLKRNLNLYEVSMLFFPRVCKICHATNVLKELVCTKCFGVSYCSEEHKTLDNHDKICSDFQKVLDSDLFMQNVDLDSLETYLIEPDTKFHAYDMRSFITSHISSQFSSEQEGLISQYYSGVLTIFHIISEMPTFTIGKKIIIHLVGASSAYEFQFVKYWETLLHLLPELRSLLLIHIGPEVGDFPSILRLCDTCWNSNKSIQLNFHSQCYHEYYDSCHVVKPDLIISFNCGLNENSSTENDTWKPSLPFFLKHENVPVILTAYTEQEAEEDLKRLLEESQECATKVKILKKGEKNPYSCTRPIKDWESPGDAVFYSNSYVTAFIVESSA